MKIPRNLNKPRNFILAALLATASAAFAQGDPPIDDLLAGGDQAPGAPAGETITACGAPMIYRLSYRMEPTGPVPEPGTAVMSITASDKIQRITLLDGVGTGAVTGTTLLATGEVAPDTGGATFKSFKDPVAGSEPGEFAVLATLTGASVTSANNTALFSVTPTAGVQLVAREGDAVAGMNGHAISTFKSVGARAGTVITTVTAAKLLPTGKKETRAAVIKRRATEPVSRTIGFEGQKRTWRGKNVEIEKIQSQTAVPANNGDGQWGGELQPVSAVHPDFAVFPVYKLKEETTPPGGGNVVFTRYRVVSLEK